MAKTPLKVNVTPPEMDLVEAHLLVANNPLLRKRLAKLAEDEALTPDERRVVGLWYLERAKEGIRVPIKFL